MPISCVLILPDAQLATGNAVGAAMGWGPNNYSVPLSADGSEPATHWGLHAWVEQSFQDMIESGVYPPQVAEAGISEDAYNAMLAALIYSFWQDYVDHFATVCAENGLMLVAPGDA